MRKIVFLQKTNSYSGAENIVVTIMRLLPKDKYQCVYVSPDGDIRNFVESEGLTFYSIKDSSMKSIKNAMLFLEPDLIHATDYGMSSNASRLHMGIPVVAHLHNNVQWLQKPLHPKNIVFTLSLPNIDGVISVSKSIENEFVHARLLLKKNHVIYNVVDLSRVRMLASDDVNEEYGVFDIAFLGRLSSPKNPFLFCDIIKQYKKINNSVKVIMIGDGELRQAVEDYIVNNGLKNNIKLIGFQKNPYKFVNKAKLLLMTSEYEGFGLAAVECLSLGKPVVCSGVGGLKDIVTSQCGAVCASTDDYVKEVTKLLHDRDYYTMKSENAKLTAQKFGNMKSYINQIISVYDECLQEKE